MRKLDLVFFLLGLVVIANTQGIVIINRGCNSFDSAGNCMTCSTRYFMDKSGICQPVNSNCNDYNQITGGCITCYSGFTIVEDTCLPSALFPSQTVFDPFCNQFEGSVCVKCAFGYYFDSNGKCKQSDPNCR